jgi:hypothetical protein
VETGVKDAHDMPAFRFAPSPTFGDEFPITPKRLTPALGGSTVVAVMTAHIVPIGMILK